MDDEIFSEADANYPPLTVAGPDVQVWTQRISQARAVRLDSVRILLVDDSPDNQRLFHRILAAAGASVVIAENGACAIDCYIANPRFDIIIMDIRMPLVDGYEATRQIRGRGFIGPVIALTAHANPGEEEKCRAAGCTDFQLKPIDRLSLLNAVERSLDAFPLRILESITAQNIGQSVAQNIAPNSEGPVLTPTLEHDSI